MRLLKVDNGCPKRFEMVKIVMKKKVPTPESLKQKKQLLRIYKIYKNISERHFLSTTGIGN